jgi:1,4-alpha-glucan branching enzyme
MTLIIIALTAVTSFAQSKTRLGYRIEGDQLIFVFNVEDYSNITDANIQVKNVFVAGEFNDWSRNSWLMEETKSGHFELSRPLSDFSGDFDWEFKFVVNGEHWAEPTNEFENKIRAKNKFGMNLHVYNLRLYSAFATEYGNVSFHLKGFKEAKEVLVTGSFNRWDETNFKMKPDDKGWSVTLQLPPDRYEYKFIVDGEWMIDPENPEKTPNEYEGYNSVIHVTKTVEFKLNGYGDAQRVILSGDFNNWSQTELPMKKKNGYWVKVLELPGGKHHYKFIVDGEWITDPDNSVLEYDDQGHVNSVCMVK